MSEAAPFSIEIFVNSLAPLNTSASVTLITTIQVRNEIFS